MGLNTIGLSGLTRHSYALLPTLMNRSSIQLSMTFLLRLSCRVAPCRKDINSHARLHLTCTHRRIRLWRASVLELPSADVLHYSLLAVERFLTSALWLGRYDYCASFDWPHGPVDVRARHSQGGLINAILEGWFPTSDDREWAFFLEDDIEVSTSFLQWAQEGRAACERDRLCIGVSL